MGLSVVVAVDGLVDLLHLLQVFASGFVGGAFAGGNQLLGLVAVDLDGCLGMGFFNGLGHFQVHPIPAVADAPPFLVAGLEQFDGCCDIALVQVDAVH